MKKYFYSNGQEKEGPVTLEELKQKDIQPKTLIWHEGLDDWKEADSVEELRELFELSPPPLDTEDDTLNATDTKDFKPEKQTVTESSHTVSVMLQRKMDFWGSVICERCS